MSLITVYRVEDHLGKGPYVHQAHRTARQAKHSRNLARRHTDAFFAWETRARTVASHPEIHPGPDGDYGLRTRWQFMDYSERRSSRNYLFGFHSTERLGQWFFGERQTLENLNMHVAAYEVPHQAVVRGEWQLIFRGPSANRVATLPLAGLVE
jgi:hypothetical protein